MAVGGVAGVVTVSLGDAVVVDDSGRAVVVTVASTALSADGVLPVVDGRIATAEPLLESDDAGCLTVERVRAGPAFLGPRAEVEE
ncbi:hypothetical protein [Mycolicibacterium aromaticivorans]|uniref:hypothetical protein n=1 Tax=Mycolicibacterium aromaticivorans TaxID=318425 RepID=UPI00103C0D6C|nr:hypothetical protein [Mycolicibacterium aromaticivorans]